MNKLSSSKAYGLDSCPVKLLKLHKSVLSIPLTDIFNHSISSGVYPNKPKLAKIIPVFKSDDASDLKKL